MMLFRLVSWPYLRTHALRSLLTLSGIAIGVSVFFAMHAANESVFNSFQETVRRIAGAAELQISAGEPGFSEDVLERLTDLFIRRGVPDYIRSDNGAEFTAHAVRDWLLRVGVRTLYIEPGSPWENGYIESFNGKLRDELLEREIFDTLLEAKVLIERWRREYNTIRPHSSLGYRPPAPEATQPWSSASATLQLQTTAEQQKQEDLR